MDCLRTDIISLFDLDFRGERIRPTDIDRLRAASRPADIDRLYRESFTWMFYGEVLPGFLRFSFPGKGDMPTDRGSSLLLSSENGIGVYAVWRAFDGAADPLEVKHQAWQLSREALQVLDALGLDIDDVERHYPFVGVRVPSNDVAAYSAAHAEALGRLFTGGYENEEDQYLRAYVETNISRRRYERLLIRWTEAVGIYGQDVEQATYERTLFRGVQLFEICILIRRLLNNINRRVDALAPSITAFRPRPWEVNKVLQRFRSLERSFLVVPPVASVEAERLLRAAYEGFGIPRMVDATRRSCDFLEHRFQWAKTQLLVALGVLTYVLDKLKAFDFLVGR